MAMIADYTHATIGCKIRIHDDDVIERAAMLKVCASMSARGVAALEKRYAEASPEGKRALLEKWNTPSRGGS